MSYLIALDVSENILNEKSTIGIGLKDSSYFTFNFPAKVKNNIFPFLTNENFMTGITGTELPISYSLSQNYPNPFNPTTLINYSLPKSGFAQLKVYDMLGREVATLVNKEQSTGNYKIELNASHLTSGIYFYRLQSGSFTETKKFILLR